MSSVIHVLDKQKYTVTTKHNRSWALQNSEKIDLMILAGNSKSKNQP